MDITRRNDLLRMFTEYLIWLKENEYSKFELHEKDFEEVYELWMTEKVNMKQVKELKNLHLKFNSLQIESEGRSLWNNYIKNAMLFGVSSIPDMLISVGIS